MASNKGGQKPKATRSPKKIEAEIAKFEMEEGKVLVKALFFLALGVIFGAIGGILGYKLHNNSWMFGAGAFVLGAGFALKNYMDYRQMEKELKIVRDNLKKGLYNRKNQDFEDSKLKR